MVKKTIKSLVGRFFSNQKNSNDEPQRYPRDVHKIDRRRVSRHAIKVCEVLSQHGHQAYVVGGAVRDLLAGLEPKDFDVATSATPEEIRPLFRRARIIGRRFRLVHVVFGREVIEASTFRGSSGGRQHTDAHGRLLRDNLFGSLQDDAARRDFTLNALYYDPLEEVVIDYHNGVSDLHSRVVRMIGDPDTRYREDPVRMMRAFRFAAKLDATIEPATLAPIKSLAPLLGNVPSSRLVDELIKALTCGNAMQSLQSLQDAGLHTAVFPLMDDICEIEGGEAFIDKALSRTDARVRGGRPNSPGFLFAALLWPLLRQEWHKLHEDGQPLIEALNQAAEVVIAQQMRTLPLQRRFQSDMRDIWFMQPRFERTSPRAIRRMLGQPRFRAAVDFMQLRAESREVDSVLAQWWMDLADGNDDVRDDMIANLRNRSGGPKTSSRRRSGRRRGRRRSSAAKRTDSKASNQETTS